MGCVLEFELVPSQHILILPRGSPLRLGPWSYAFCACFIHLLRVVECRLWRKAEPIKLSIPELPLGEPGNPAEKVAALRKQQPV